MEGATTTKGNYTATHTGDRRHTVSYTYDTLRRVTKTSAMLDTQEVKTEYEYDTADRLSRTVHNNTSTK